MKQLKILYGKIVSGCWLQVIRYIVDCNFIYFIKIYRIIKNVFIYFYYDFKLLCFKGYLLLVNNNLCLYINSNIV